MRGKRSKYRNENILAGGKKVPLHTQYRSFGFRVNMILKDERIVKVSSLFCIDFKTSGYSYCLQHVSENSSSGSSSPLITSEKSVFTFFSIAKGEMF